MAPRPLFRKFELFAIQQHQQQQAKEAVRELLQDRLSEDEEKLTAEILSNFAMDLPILDESGIYQSDRQVQLDARRLPNRMIFNRSRPVPVDGTEITIHIPFKGNSGMFDVAPSQRDLNPPVGDIDETNKEILLTYQTADESSPIKASYERTLDAIKRHLEWLRPAVIQTDGLKQVVRAELAKRKQAAQSHVKVVDSLGLPRQPPKKS
jgi:hypothetical protein